MSGNGKPNEKVDENGKVRTVRIKIDSSTIAAIIALAGAAGSAWYGHSESKDAEIDTTGHKMATTDSYKKTRDAINGLVAIAKKQRQEILALRDDTEWCNEAINALGQHHPTTFRRLNVELPIDETEGLEDLPEGLIEIQEALPEEVSFPKLDKIREFLEEENGS